MGNPGATSAVTHGGERRNVRSGRIISLAGRTLHITPMAVARAEHAPHPGAGAIPNETADLGLAGRDRDPLGGGHGPRRIVAQVTVGRDGA